MDHLIPSLARLLEPFRPCFHPDAFFVFHHVAPAWILCLGKRSLSEVWQHSCLDASRHFSALYHFFADASWDPGDIAGRLALLLLSRFAPDGRVWLVVDDTLCRKRGAKVAFGGIFLDPVLSSKRHKVLRFGINQVVVGLAVRLPWRPDRFFCLPLLCEPALKKGAPGYRKKTEVAARLAAKAAGWFPDRDVCLVGDSAYINAATLRGRPANLHVLGPIHPKAALYEPAPPKKKGQKGRPPKKGRKLPRPAEMFEDTAAYPARARRFDFPGGPRELRTQQVRGVLWYTAAKEERLQVVLVRDPSEGKGKWRDLALVCSDPGMGVAEAVEGYCRRWSIELTFHDCKQHLGLSEPMVRKKKSVERAHAMAYLCYTLVVLWYGENHEQAQKLRRERPWYPEEKKAGVTFTDMLGTLRLALWQGRLFGEKGAGAGHAPTPQMLDFLLHHIAAVR